VLFSKGSSAFCSLSHAKMLDGRVFAISSVLHALFTAADLHHVHSSAASHVVLSA